jgi:hypothetical protein
MSRHATDRPRRSLAVLAILLFSFVAHPLAGQAGESRAPWFGLTVPEGLELPPIGSALDVSEFAPAPARVPPDDPSAPELTGDLIRRDVATIVEFAHASRTRGDQLWGRVAGFQGGRDAILWAAEEFRRAGIPEVSVQSFSANTEMWWPESWEVRLLADSTYGSGSTDVVLHSALPISGSSALIEPLEAPLIEISSDDGFGHDFASAEVRGKVAVQRVRYLARASTEWEWEGRRAHSLIARGAVAVINVVDQPGNLRVMEGICRGPCFNLGGADGDFLLQAMRHAHDEGLPEPTIRLTLNAAQRAGLGAANAVAVIPGRSTQAIIIAADVDGWFDAAGDTADGLAVLMALARHFAKAENAPERTLVFVATAGQHSRGLDGPANFVRMNPGIARSAVLVINLRQIAQLRTTLYPWSVLPTEEEMTVTISNGARFLDDVTRRGVARYGFLARPVHRMPEDGGDPGGFLDLGVPFVRVDHEGSLHHTSGDVIESISTPGLERAARFFAYFLRQVDAAPTRMLDP